jgi:cytochrome c-type biogenesis protein CcmH/NrfG
VSRRLVALLMALAVIQGLVIAVILVRLTRPASPAPAAEVLSKAPANNAAASPVPKVVPNAGAPLPREQTGDPAGVPSAPAPPPAGTHPAVDESGTIAPTCEALLDAAPREGTFPGAALEQSQLARKAIVQGRVDEAQRAYCKAVRWDANNPNIYFDLAQLLLLRRDGAAGAEWAKRGLALDATNTRGHSLLGDGLARVGDTEGARRAWLTASNVADPSRAAVRNLTQSSLEEAERALLRRDFARAERFFRRAAVLDPESASALIGLTTALLRVRDAAAARWAERAVERGAGDPRAHFVLGDARLAAGDRAGAKSAYARAGELGHPDAARRLRRVE